MQRSLIVALLMLSATFTAHAAAMDDVHIQKSGLCNRVFTWLVVKSSNTSRSIEVTLQIEKEVRGSVSTSETQVLLPPGGSKRVICNGAPSPYAGAYTANLRKLGASYR